jgi:hypothetical protein
MKFGSVWVWFCNRAENAVGMVIVEIAELRTNRAQLVLRAGHGCDLDGLAVDLWAGRNLSPLREVYWRPGPRLAQFDDSNGQPMLAVLLATGARTCPTRRSHRSLQCRLNLLKEVFGRGRAFTSELRESAPLL